MADVVYYSFERLEGGFDGLVRVTNSGATLERVEDGQWVEDRRLAERFTNPSGDMVRVDDTQAGELAARYGAAA